ncbi:MAG: ribosome recycling factor [Candidatus Dormibacteraeota bacterium]|nr:ribosome recycling factor [Candidatus Dormibacteraeota bacterium]
MSEITQSSVLAEAREKMNKALEHLEHELSTIRTGRANPALIEHLPISYYGTPTPLNQLAQIGTPEARLLLVQPYDRSYVGTIDKAIREAGLGLNPSNDGQVVRVPIPPLTEERRREYVRLAKQRAEESRVAIRNARRDEIQRVQRAEKAGDVPADESHRISDQLQKLTDQMVERVDERLHRKEAEVMEV